MRKDATTNLLLMLIAIALIAIAISPTWRLIPCTPNPDLPIRFISNPALRCCARPTVASRCTEEW